MGRHCPCPLTQTFISDRSTLRPCPLLLADSAVRSGSTRFPSVPLSREQRTQIKWNKSYARRKVGVVGVFGDLRGPHEGKKTLFCLRCEVRDDEFATFRRVLDTFGPKEKEEKKDAALSGCGFRPDSLDWIFLKWNDTTTCLLRAKYINTDTNPYNNEKLCSDMSESEQPYRLVFMLVMAEFSYSGSSC